MRTPEGQREKGTDAISEAIVIENFSKLMIGNIPQI